MAVWPPADVVASLAALPRPDVAGLRWTSPEQWHVTVRFLGEADVEEAVAGFRAIEAPGRVIAEAGPCTGHFGRRVLHVPVAGLGPVATATVTATAGVGEPPPERPFAGHLTLARARDRRGVDLRPLSGVPVGGRWPVEELTLVASRLGGRSPARYEVVEVLPLGG